MEDCKPIPLPLSAHSTCIYRSIVLIRHLLFVVMRCVIIYDLLTTHTSNYIITHSFLGLLHIIIKVAHCATGRTSVLNEGRSRLDQTPLKATPFKQVTVKIGANNPIKRC